VVPLFVGRPKSIRALEEAVAGGRELVLSAQRDHTTEEPREDDVFRVGTLGSIIQLLRLPDQTVKVLVEGKARVEIKRFARSEPSFAVEIEPLVESDDRSPEATALIRSVQSAFETYVKLNKKVPPEILNTVQQVAWPAASRTPWRPT
jgi:ATP-dependent Lon protease